MLLLYLLPLLLGFGWYTTCLVVISIVLMLIIISIYFLGWEGVDLGVGEPWISY